MVLEVVSWIPRDWVKLNNCKKECLELVILSLTTISKTDNSLKYNILLTVGRIIGICVKQKGHENNDSRAEVFWPHQRENQEWRGKT